MFIISLIKRLLRRRPSINIDTAADTVPQAFGIPEENFQKLVQELSKFIREDDRLASLDTYLKGPLFNELGFNLNDPKHAAVLGYAFCAAVLIKRDIQRQTIANKVLKAFYPDEVPPKVN